LIRPEGGNALFADSLPGLLTSGAAKRALLKKKLDFVGCFYKIKSLSGKGGDPLLERFRFKGSSICYEWQSEGGNQKF
jgi:hypothetical protein